MTTEIASRYRVIDVDSHVTEPADLWTSRVSKRWGDLVPQVRYDERGREDRWFLGEQRLAGVAATAFSGWPEFPPAHPASLAEADPASWQAAPRLARLDEYGIYAQVLYPNVLGFQSHAFMSLPDLALASECVRAYNDFLVEFCAVDPNRLLPLMMLPFWDVEESVAEIERAANLGHRGIVFGAQFPNVGLAPVHDEHWFPIYALAQDLELSINFHIGITARTADDLLAFQRNVKNDKPTFVKESTLMFFGNAHTVADVILGGVCDRFPRLDFVSVESGAGWLPWFLEALDWQWSNAGARQAFPARLLPSEYFRRQVHGSFWYEHDVLARSLELYPDNLMFETDFPHPTSLTPGPASFAENPRVVLDKHLGDLPDDLVRKVVQDNAARLYKVDVSRA